jgi:hypothetical protein
MAGMRGRVAVAPDEAPDEDREGDAVSVQDLSCDGLLRRARIGAANADECRKAMETAGVETAGDLFHLNGAQHLQSYLTDTCGIKSMCAIKIANVIFPRYCDLLQLS